MKHHFLVILTTVQGYSNIGMSEVSERGEESEPFYSRDPETAIYLCQSCDRVKALLNMKHPCPIVRYISSCIMHQCSPKIRNTPRWILKQYPIFSLPLTEHSYLL